MVLTYLEGVEILDIVQCHRYGRQLSEDLSSLRKKVNKEGKKIVMTTGCYDILHLGHVVHFVCELIDSVETLVKWYKRKPKGWKE